MNGWAVKNCEDNSYHLTSRAGKGILTLSVHFDLFSLTFATTVVKGALHADQSRGTRGAVRLQAKVLTESYKPRGNIFVFSERPFLRECFQAERSPRWRARPQGSVSPPRATDGCSLPILSLQICGMPSSFALPLRGNNQMPL